MVVLANEVKRRYGDKILAFSLNPGSQSQNMMDALFAHHRLGVYPDIRTDLTQHIHANEWRIASWLVSMIEKYICYDVDLGAITRKSENDPASKYAHQERSLRVCIGKSCTRGRRRIWRIVMERISSLSPGCRRIPV